MQKIGVSQKAIIFNEEGKFLILRRTNTAPSNPNKWDLPGGDLDFGEDAVKGISREIKEETGLEIENIKPFDVESHINKKNEFWVTVAYAAKTKSDKVKLSFEHNDFKWIDNEKFLKLESSEKLKRFVRIYVKFLK
jgi:ADP-ribose pyrophosphatase YjhB (NUDIX family)